MKRSIHIDVWISLVLIITGALFFMGSLRFPNDVGYFPRIFSILLIVCSLFVLWDGIKKSLPKETEKTKEPASEKKTAGITGNSFVQVLAGFGIIILYTVLINVLGFFTASTLFLFGLMYFLRMRRWILMIAVTAGVIAVVYFVFVVQLNVIMPRGLLI